MEFLRWVLDRFGENKYVIGKWRNWKKWDAGWIGGNDRIVFTDRPDPLLLSYQDRTKEMRRQIREGVK